MQICSCSFNEEGVHLAGRSCVDACGLCDTKESIACFISEFVSRRARQVVMRTCLHKRLQPCVCLLGAHFTGGSCSVGSLTELGKRFRTWAGLVRASFIATISSLLKRLGTSPVLRIPLTSSKKASFMSCVSSNRNTVALMAIFQNSDEEAGRITTSP